MASKLSEDQVESFRQVFAEFDRDGNGKITTTELGDAMHELNYYPNETELKQMIAAVDKDGSGTVEFEEFCEMMTMPMKATPEVVAQYKKTFAVFDKDNSGSITVAELGSVMRSMNYNVSDEQLQTMISQVDFDQSGCINFEEFLKLMLPA